MIPETSNIESGCFFFEEVYIFHRNTLAQMA